MTYPDEIRFEVSELLAAVEELRDAQNVVAEALYAVENAHESLVIETTEVLSSELVDTLQEMLPTDGDIERVARMVRTIIKFAVRDVEEGR